ncbi:hypothetical protein GGI35DRAFT_458757, partial [Trichoderma velutinum]
MFSQFANHCICILLTLHLLRYFINPLPVIPDIVEFKLGNWCGTPVQLNMAPSAQSTEDKPASGNRREFLEMLKKNATERDLRTITADPDMKNIPPDIDAMLQLDSSAQLAVPRSRHTCITEKKLPVKPSHKSDPLALWIGFFGKIPRWKKGQVVQFAARAEGYPTPKHAIFAAYKLNIAAREWNKLDIGVTFKWVTNIEDACFELTYGGDKGDVVASAFFPNNDNLNTLFVYQLAFDERLSPYQSNFFLHELGHVLGLRHEFAFKEGGAVQFGPANKESVMNYNDHPPSIQESDIVSAKAFYNLQSPYKNLEIVDWYPDN